MCKCIKCKKSHNRNNIIGKKGSVITRARLDLSCGVHFGRALHFKCIPREIYTVRNILNAYDALEGDTLKVNMLKKLKVII